MPRPTERAALDAEIGRLQTDNEKLKAQLAGRDGTVNGKIDEPLPKSDPLKKPEPKVAEGERKIEIPLPSDRDMDRMMAFLEKAWRRLIEMANRVQKDVPGARFEFWRMSRPTVSSLSAPSAVSASKIVSASLVVRDAGTGFTDITREARNSCASAGAHEGALTLFIRHTSASLTIQENADPSSAGRSRHGAAAARAENAGWVHDTEGPDDMPAHIKTMLTATSLQIPVLDGAMALGTWQAST
jgi:secondary thiamine-phosphate synthase enzyme